MHRHAKLHISSMLKRRGDCSVLYDNHMDWNNRRLKRARSSSEQNCCSFLYSPSAVLPIWYDHKQAWLCLTVILLQELFSGLSTLVRSGTPNCSRTPNCSSHPIFCSPFSPTLLFNRFAFHQSETTVSKCQMGEEDFLIPCQLYTPFLSVVFHTLEIICFLELCALLTPLIFFYSNLIQNRQNAPSFMGWIISRVFLIYILSY